MRDAERGPVPWRVPGLRGFPKGPQAQGTGHTATHLALQLVDELLETVDLEPPVHLSL